MGDGIGHVAVAGIGASLLFGTSPTWTALVVAVVAALVIEFLRTRGSATGDLALALVFYGGIAAGVVLASRSATNTNLQPYLFGSILTATANDVWTVIGLGAVIVVAIAFTGRALLAVVLDEDSARVAGIPARALEHDARGAHRGDGRDGDAHRRRAAHRRAHGAAGRDQPAAGAVVPRHAASARSGSAWCRRCSGSSPPGSGRSPPAAPSCSWPRRCSRWRRSSPEPAAPAPRPTRSSPAPTDHPSFWRHRPQFDVQRAKMRGRVGSLARMPTLFTRIIDGEIPGVFVWRDPQCVVFLSINPMHTGHTLVVPPRRGRPLDRPRARPRRPPLPGGADHRAGADGGARPPGASA